MGWRSPGGIEEQRFAGGLFRRSSVDLGKLQAFATMAQQQFAVWVLPDFDRFAGEFEGLVLPGDLQNATVKPHAPILACHTRFLVTHHYSPVKLRVTSVDLSVF